MSQVYFVHAPSVNLVKIGRSADAERRFIELRLISPVPLQVIGLIDGGYEKEAELHKRFAPLRSHGEWFHATADLLEFAWRETVFAVWNRGSAEWREAVRDQLFPDAPVMDARFG